MLKQPLPKPFHGYRIDQQSADDQLTLIFLHDALGSVGQWKDFPEKLANHLKLNVLVYDRKGHGQSDEDKQWDKAYLHREAEDLHVLIKHFEIKHPILIGVSDGGSIALIYASRYPVKGLISLSGHYRVEQETLEGVKSKMYDKHDLVQKLSIYHAYKAEPLVNNWLHTWTSEYFRDWHIKDELIQITKPTLLIQGDNDPYASPTHQNEIAALMPAQSKVVMMPNTGHFPHLEHTDRTIDHIVDFLNYCCEHVSQNY